jgi:hypothetical protein
LAFFDNQHRPVMGPTGYAKQTFDEYPDGRSELAYYGPDGKLILNRFEGFARKETVYQANNSTRMAFYGPDGLLLDGPDGYAIGEFQYDSKGQVVSERFFDKSRVPCYNSGGIGTLQRTSGAVWINGRAYKDEQEGIEVLHRTRVPLLHVEEINGIHTAAAAVDLLPGDDLWSLGDWSSPAIISKAQQDSKGPTDLLSSLKSGFFSETHTDESRRARLIIVRNGKKLETLLPPLGADGKLGIRIEDRWLPHSVYEQILHEPVSAGGPRSSNPVLHPIEQVH